MKKIFKITNIFICAVLLALAVLLSIPSIRTKIFGYIKGDNNNTQAQYQIIVESSEKDGSAISWQFTNSTNKSIKVVTLIATNLDTNSQRTLLSDVEADKDKGFTGMINVLGEQTPFTFGNCEFSLTFKVDNATNIVTAKFACANSVSISLIEQK
jgi:hypothetical protein